MAPHSKTPPTHDHWVANVIFGSMMVTAIVVQAVLLSGMLVVPDN